MKKLILSIVALFCAVQAHAWESGEATSVRCFLSRPTTHSQFSCVLKAYEASTDPTECSVKILDKNGVSGATAEFKLINGGAGIEYSLAVIGNVESGAMSATKTINLNIDGSNQVVQKYDLLKTLVQVIDQQDLKYSVSCYLDTMLPTDESP